MPTETAPLLERIANGRTDLVFDVPRRRQRGYQH